MNLYNNKRRIFFWIGSFLSIAAAVVLGSIPFFYFRSAIVGKHLLQQASTLVNRTNSNMNSTTQNAQSVQAISEGLNVPAFQAGQIIGEVVIPTLSLQAPLVQGTNPSQLDTAVGHLVTSVLPGKPGTTLIAAHNATWFRHINRLKPGDLIQVKTMYGTFNFHVTTAKVVRTGDSVPNTLDSSIVLESCYPLNALYLTPYRFLVYGKLVQISSTRIAASKPPTGTNYYVTIPQNIVNEGLTLSTNTLPMGTLTYTGNPSSLFTQSDSAWSATHTMIELYLAWIHASADKNLVAMTAIAPNAVTPKLTGNPFFGVNLLDVKYLSDYNVSLHVQGEQLLTATGTTQVRIHGKSYKIVLTAYAHGQQVKVTKIEIRSLFP
ncbi:class D sortase [Alicyclobacillus mengziensis]|uniref:Class D sortase n=1 Tax=Alicyclobacillus mengziensis TaxID=2931921 RepID=A0A9X7Z7E4_9BACL|nr:class D sortase [Alicyclobacillus mengziensis]QSO48332.1 class D sortase [Alicyclobacillus mengziensis]